MLQITTLRRTGFIETLLVYRDRELMIFEGVLSEIISP